MQKRVLADQWYLPLPDGITLKTIEERRAVLIECSSPAQKALLFKPLGPGSPTPAQMICARAKISPCEIKYFCIKLGKKIDGYIDLSVLEGCMELAERSGYPELSDGVMIDLLGKSLIQGNSFGVVHMGNNISLFSSANIGKFSKCGEAKNMHGADVSRWWPPDQLKIFVAALERHPGGLTNYQYQARNWEGQRMLFTANARLWWYRGDVVRVTETVNAEPVLFEI